MDYYIKKIKRYKRAPTSSYHNLSIFILSNERRESGQNLSETTLTNTRSFTYLTRVGCLASDFLSFFLFVFFLFVCVVVWKCLSVYISYYENDENTHHHHHPTKDIWEHWANDDLKNLILFISIQAQIQEKNESPQNFPVSRFYPIFPRFFHNVSPIFQ